MSGFLDGLKNQAHVARNERITQGGQSNLHNCQGRAQDHIAALRQCVEALKRNQWVEFVDSDHGSIWFCSDCRNDKKYEHHPECSIHAAIAAGEKVLNE